MERKETTYLGNENYLIYYISEYIEIPEIRLYHTLHIQAHPVFTQFLQPEAEQLLLFCILFASVILTTSFVKRSTTCSRRLQVAIKQEVSIQNRDFTL